MWSKSLVLFDGSHSRFEELRSGFVLSPFPRLQAEV